MTDQQNQQNQQKKPVEAASAGPGEKRSASRPRAKAAESGDPAVQKLLADRQTAQQNAAYHKDLAEQSNAAREGHEERVAEADARLAELGFE